MARISRPFGTHLRFVRFPALKRRARVQMSLRDLIFPFQQILGQGFERLGFAFEGAQAGEGAVG